MGEPWGPAADAGTRRSWEQVLRPVATELRAEAPQLTQSMVTRMQAALPAVMPDAQTVAENAVSTQQTIEALADGMSEGIDPRKLELPAATLAFAQAGVHRQVPPSQLVRAYRLGHEYIWQWCFERIALRCEDTAVLRAATELFTRWTFAYADTAITRVEEAVEAERERWLRSAMAARGAAITAIISGEERNQDRASKRLRYALGHDHLGVAAAVVNRVGDDDPQEVLLQAVSRLASIVGAAAHLVNPTGVTTCIAWISRAGGFSARDTTALTQCHLPGLRIGVGEPGRGLDGFRRSAVEAGHARRVTADAKLTGVALYRDLAVPALASVDSELAATFVHRVLGPLAGTDGPARRAAEALTVYLEENRSRTGAAARLLVHPNTITYRVKQAEQILGRRPDVASLDLRVALALLPSFRAKDTS
ncbi:CdaR family transcriptional regulator [Mycobacterium sp. EPa45]|uniref:PucR family transcriptional regulator n=1 Tax=Mycobacterium sp. EPa45 TaxID=1545728 RepID=UPI0006426789|nr:PucR family transcriptional regulator [Mycobacterium sp. EPa45]AKK30055.1 hypothetical protein AB431_29050 [Mycobacterium sp. EPa45]